MCKKLIHLVSFILVLSVSSSVCADLVGHWKLDDGSGTVAADSSGNGNDGTIVNNPTWIPGIGGTALEFHGDTSVYGGGDYIDCGNDASLDITGPTSIALWIRPDADDPEGQGSPGGETAPMAKAMAGMSPSWSYQVRYGWGGPEPYMAFTFNTSPRAWAFVGRNLERYEWVHIACSYDGTTLKCYLNGEETDSTPMGAITSSSTPVLIGSDGWGCDWIGAIDDVRIYDHALSVSEIMGAMEGEVWPYALAPKPEDGALCPETWVNLSWLPGGLAVSHDVYIGDNFDNVNAGAEGTFVGNQAGTFIVVGFPGFPFPDGLVPGTTYYWRIDEVNDTEPNSPWKGDVWSFSIPPKTAYYPDPADGAEQVAPDVMLSWTGGFGSKLHTVYFGDNFDDVDNAAGGLPQGTAIHTPGTLKMAKTYYWRVDEFDVIETHKGDVWSFTTQGAVGSPDPANGAVDVEHTPTLTWSPGVYAASHQVYFGTDKEVVRNADTGSPEYKGSGNLGAESYEPEKLEWNSTYYWRIDEANNANPDSPWTGNVWSFTTANFLVVDDFESYNDLDPDDPDSNRIFNVWIDGYGIPTNGSLVGYENPPFAEQTIVHGGNQSMPLYYDNSVGYSEATLTLTYPRDWTENGITTLSIWFRGFSDNAAETLYVALNGNAVVSHDNPNAAQIDKWTEWVIPLSAPGGFADQGVNLANVNTIALGLGNKNNPQAGGSGTMYFDDIRLYPPAPTPPSDTNLVGWWKLDESSDTIAVDSSGHENNGSLNGTAMSWMPNDGMIGGALSFDGTASATDYVEISTAGISLTAGTIAMWGKLPPDPQLPATRYFVGHTTIPAWSDRIQLYMDNADTVLDLGLGDSHARHIDIMSLTTETWYHVALTWDGGNYVVYVNGEEKANGSYIGLDTLNTVADIGNDGNPGDRTEAFNGLLDDVRIYNVALTGAEISYLAGAN